MKNRKKTTMCTYEWIKNELEIAERYGVPVYVDGVSYTMERHEELLNVLEDGAYMKEYIDNEEGVIVQINFDSIKNV